MDALVPAFIAALLTGVGDRSAWLAAILADRYARPLAVSLGIAAAHVIAAAVAAGAAVAVAPILTPNAKGLLLAFALLSAGFGSMWRMRAPGRFERWRTGAFPTAVVGGTMLAFGGNAAFLAFGFAARGPSPALAAAGVAAGGIVAAFAAASCGEAAWLKLPLRPFRAVAGLLLIVAGTLIALSALRIL